MNVILQVPVNKDLKDKAAKKAEKMGFSSLQESVRLFLNQLASEKIEVMFEPQTEKLTLKNEKRYLRMSNDFEKNKNVYSAESLDEFLNKLNR